jgi:hypothetical protein
MGVQKVFLHIIWEIRETVNETTVEWMFAWHAMQSLPLFPFFTEMRYGTHQENLLKN